MNQTPAIPLSDPYGGRGFKNPLTQLHFSRTANFLFKNEVPKLKT
jgi:hypothetical protein